MPLDPPLKYIFKMNILKQIRQVERIFNKMFYGSIVLSVERKFTVNDNE